MKYASTRGAAPVLEFDDVLLTGLASDGGLYVPESWPELLDPTGQFGREPYLADALTVMGPFVVGRIPSAEFARMVLEAYRTFDTREVTPLRSLGDGVYLLELFHGPTLAFKDIALQLVGRLFEHELAQRAERATVVTATSGDTGSAAIAAVQGRYAMDAVVLHPAGRVTEVQRRQMTTVDAPNLHNVAVEGTFDDCQDLVKAMFADEAFRRDLRLSAMNSINWARVMAQIVYYVRAAGLLGSPVAFAVPTGNFGNVYAGYVAARMGTPITRLVVGSNRNDILTRFLATGVLEVAEVHPTLSPSMDIQVSSNVERLLFDLYDRDGEAVAAAMVELRSTGRLDVGSHRLAAARRIFVGARLDDVETSAVMRDVYRRTGVLVDPHTAVGLGAAEVCLRDRDVPVVALATAHPAKFPDAVEAATGVRPGLPDHLADLLDRPERFTTLPNDLGVVQAFVRRAVASSS